MSGHVYAYITCTRTKWEATVAEMAEMEGKTEAEVLADWEDDSDYNADSGTIRLDEPIEEHGWIDRAWNSRVLHDGRNDVSPIVNVDPDDVYDLHEEVKDALEWLPGGYEDNSDGTFYASDSEDPFDDPWSYSYAIHFVEKYYGDKGWTERPWKGVEDCLKNAGHNPYPHTPGALYDCQACESQCFCSTDPGVMPCLYCSITTEGA